MNRTKPFIQREPWVLPKQGVSSELHQSEMAYMAISPKFTIQDRLGAIDQLQGAFGYQTMQLILRDETDWRIRALCRAHLKNPDPDLIWVRGALADAHREGLINNADWRWADREGLVAQKDKRYPKPVVEKKKQEGIVKLFGRFVWEGVVELSCRAYDILWRDVEAEFQRRKAARFGGPKKKVG